MPKIEDRVLEEIRARVDLVEFIGEYFPLQKAGPLYKACCPFHREKTASFTVTPARQTYRCFGCGAHGDVFKFLMQREGIDFIETIRRLAKKTGINIAEFEAQEAKVRPLYDALNAAKIYFMQQLQTPSAEFARQYLMGQQNGQRQITPATIERFCLGYSPNEWQTLRNHLNSKGFSDELLLKAGLIGESKNPDARNKFYDFFRNRLMFPLFDQNRRVIGFSARALDKKEKAKYINTPQTELFTKGEVFYGLNVPAVYNKGLGVISEGQMDVVRAHQEGLEFVFGTSGTALTEAHVEFLRRKFFRKGENSDRIVLSFDSDEAGRNAAERAAKLVIGRINAGVTFIEGAKDVAEYFERKVGTAQDLEFQFKGNYSAMEYILARIRERAEQVSRIDVNSLEFRISALRELQTVIEKSPEEARAMIINEFSQVLDIPYSAVEDYLRSGAQARAKEQRASETRAASAQTPLIGLEEIDVIDVIESKPIGLEQHPEPQQTFEELALSRQRQAESVFLNLLRRGR